MPNYWRPYLKQARMGVLGLLLSALSLPSAIAEESIRLFMLLRLLDQAERQAESIARLPRDETSRYHFDYPRLREDLQRMRQGIRDHLSPQRAQPRDPVPLHGDYRQETEVPDEPGR